MAKETDQESSPANQEPAGAARRRRSSGQERKVELIAGALHADEAKLFARSLKGD